MKTICEAIELEGGFVKLELLSHQYDSEFMEIIQRDSLHKLWYTSVPEPENLAKDVERRLKLYQQQEMLPFAVMNKKSGKAVGMTAYNKIDQETRRVEIGATWYSREVQRTAINTEAKFLLLLHAFETLSCVAVEFRTHFLNQQSRRAIERLGAKLDGVLRSHMYTRTGELRDTCVYSIIASEWPSIKHHLQWQLEKPR